MPDPIGYVVAVYNQASGLPEAVTTCLCWDREVAERDAAAERARYAEIGRGERFVVCEVIPVSEDTGGGAESGERRSG